MRTHGWGGCPPTSDDEARARILEATRRCIDRHGVGVGIAEVARELGVTRPTVYRYYRGTDELLFATVSDSARGFLDQVDEDLGDRRGEPEEMVVEVVALVLEQLPRQPYLWLMLTKGRASLFATGVTSPLSLDFGRAVVERTGVDWTGLGLDHADVDELVEQVARTFQSLMLDPGTPPRHGDALRSWLRRWLAPSVAALVRARAG